MGKTFTPSPQQKVALDWVTDGSGSSIIEAVAGAGKTTTLVEMVKRTEGSVAFCAYNKAIADEIRERVEPLGLGNRVQVGTVHSFGWRALRRTFPNAIVEGNKLHKLYTTYLGDPKVEPLYGFAAAAASMAKQVGIGSITPFSSKEAWLSMVEHYDLADLLPEEGDPDYLNRGLRQACALLKESQRCLTMFDFDDMVYEPVRQGLRMWRNDWVFLDEAQDTNAARRALVKMMLQPRGRLVAVGDPRQAIYGFTGADSDSLDKIASEFNASRIPLTTTYRCPRTVVEVAQRWVSHIEAASTAPDGEVLNTTSEEFISTNLFKTLTAQDAILCRNTAPLVSLAYGLIRRGVGCRIEGKSIGEGLIKLATRWSRIKTVTALVTKLEEHKDREIAKAVAKNNEARAAQIEDQVDTLLEIAASCEAGATVPDLLGKIMSLFGDTPAGETPKVLTLCTIHRSKGREWPTVAWWGVSKYSPSKYARQAWQLLQEDNLCYVAATRAKARLIMVEVVSD